MIQLWNMLYTLCSPTLSYFVLQGTNLHFSLQGEINVLKTKHHQSDLVKVTSLTCSVLLMCCGIGELKKPHYRSHASYGVSSDSQALTKN